MVTRDCVTHFWILFAPGMRKARRRSAMTKALWAIFRHLWAESHYFGPWAGTSEQEWEIWSLSEDRLLLKKCVYCKHLDIFSVEILRLLPACPPSGDGRIFPYTVIPQEAELKATQSSQVAWANQSKHVIAHIMQLKGLCKKNQERKKNKKHAARRCCISLLRTPVPWPWHSGKRQR